VGNVGAASGSGNVAGSDQSWIDIAIAASGPLAGKTLTGHTFEKVVTTSASVVAKFGARAIGGSTYAAFTFVQSAAVNGHVSQKDVVKASAAGLGFLLGGPTGGMVATGVAELLDRAGAPFPNLAGVPNIYDRALSNPTGPEAAYSRALAVGSPVEIAHAAINIPSVYPDAILRAVAGIGTPTSSSNSIDTALAATGTAPNSTTQAKAQTALATGIYPDAILRGAAGHGGGGGPTSPSTARGTSTDSGSAPTPGPSFPTGPNGITPSLPGANVSSTSSGSSIGGPNTGSGPSSSSSGMGLGIGPNGITPSLPVVLDLNGNGVEISLSYKAAFDYDGDGFREPTAWVAPGDGILVIDLNADGTRGAGDGKIDQAKELVLSMWGPAGSTDLQAVYKRNYGVPMAA